MFPQTANLLRASASSRRLLLQPAIHLRSLATATTTPETTTTTTTTAPPTAAEPRPPYHVARTPSQNLAIYHIKKRGGNFKLTQIKKIEGDRQAFRRKLAQDLGLELDKVLVKTPTGHVEVIVGFADPRWTPLALALALTIESRKGSTL